MGGRRLVLRFVDRVEELRALSRLAREGSPTPIYLYGPEGCGKTRLLKEFINGFNGVGVYIDALEEYSARRVVTLSPKVKKVEEPLVAEASTGHVGKWFTERVIALVDKLALKCKLKDSNIVLVVDDIAKPIGLDRIEWYIKWLYENIWKLTEEYEPESILIIATTSEGKSLNLVLKHTYTQVRLIRNQSREAFNQLAEQLTPPSKECIEEAWRLTGGNPRKLIELAVNYKWNTRSWIDSLKRELTDLTRTIKAGGLVGELRKVIEDPDNIYYEASPEMNRLYSILLENNMVIYKYIKTIDDKDTPKNLELGIGEYYAWQIPAYKETLKHIIKHQ